MSARVQPSDPGPEEESKAEPLSLHRVARALLAALLPRREQRGVGAHRGRPRGQHGGSGVLLEPAAVTCNLQLATCERQCGLPDGEALER